MRSVTALFSGVIDVLRAPHLVVAAMVLSVIVAAPFAALLRTELRDALASRPANHHDSNDIDPDWWLEFREHASGLAATFTPAIVGFAAPLDNLSSLLFGTARPLILFVPYVLAAMAWAFLWGAALERFAHQSQRCGFWRAGRRTFARFIVISAAASITLLVLYFVLHPILFAVALVAVSVIADYSRVVIVMSRIESVIGAFTASWRFVVRNAFEVLALYLAGGLLFVTVLAIYAALDLSGATPAQGWRGVVIGQAYIVARLIVRLTFGAGALRLYRELDSLARSHPLSELRVNPGPPAAT